MHKFFLSFWLLFPAPVWAWNAEGHMIVAQIAYNHLEATTKNRCDALIAVALPNASTGTADFVTASCWADDFKTALGTGIWHYIDLPISLDGTPTNGVVPADFDVVQAIQLNLATLQNPQAALADQATSLRYLIHFVGDIQQPLHCSTAVWATKPGGDAGGNGFSINGSWSNLHSLWDAGGGFLTDSLNRPLSASSRSTLNSKVASIESLYPYASHPTLPADPMAWAQAGQANAATNVYVGVTRSSTPTTLYLDNAQATTAQLMAQGGQLLADLLNDLFSPPALQLDLVAFQNGKIQFSWATIAGGLYRVQWKSDLSETTWHDLVDLTANGSRSAFNEAATQQQRFYRVVRLN